MAIFPKVPTRFFYTGDRPAAKAQKGFGKKRLGDLMTDLKPQKQTHKTGQNSFTAPDGTTVNTSTNYGISTVHIHVPRPAGVVPVEMFRCFCGPCIADAIVTAVKNYNDEVICAGDEEPEDPCVEDYGDTVTWGEETYQEYMGGARYYYDVDICTSSNDEEDEGILAAQLENYPIQSAGWEKYYVGQQLYAMFLPSEPVENEDLETCIYGLLLREPPLSQIEDIVLIQTTSIFYDT